MKASLSQFYDNINNGEYNEKNIYNSDNSGSNSFVLML